MENFLYLVARWSLFVDVDDEYWDVLVVVEP